MQCKLKRMMSRSLPLCLFFYQLDWVLFFLQVQALFAHWFLLHGLVGCFSLYFCSCSVTESCPSLAIPRTVACQTSLSFTFSQSLLKFMSFESMMPSNHFILCHLLLLLPSIFPSPTVFSNESALLIWWPSIGTSASVLPWIFFDFLKLISFRID